ncbi:hypothetical protein [Cobetia sp. L2A1]|uniref:hypothetical protein n=1 Tax=Cobetia sp. L2A1 TaxID=2686360 RepID=UPI00131A75ED|nr:hypothetical protein [Cobetia sp. L2A1]
MKVYKPEWQCTLDVTEGPDSTDRWLTKFAWKLRALADRVDGGSRTMKIDCNVTPALSSDEIDTCLGKGFALSQNLMMQLANHGACEDVLRYAKAELYAEEQHPL